MKPIIALKTFFGLKPGQTLKGFADEIKELSEEEKTELAKGACEELGEKYEETS